MAPAGALYTRGAQKPAGEGSGFNDGHARAEGPTGRERLTMARRRKPYAALGPGSAARRPVLQSARRDRQRRQPRQPWAPVRAPATLVADDSRSWLTVADRQLTSAILR